MSELSHRATILPVLLHFCLFTGWPVATTRQRIACEDAMPRENGDIVPSSLTLGIYSNNNLILWSASSFVLLMCLRGTHSTQANEQRAVCDIMIDRLVGRSLR